MSKGEPKSGIVRLLKRWFVDSLSYMALGLFATLIVGTIIEQIAKIPGCAFINSIISFDIRIAGQAVHVGNVLTFGPVVGAAIGVAVAHGLKHKPLVVFTSAVTGALGYMMCYNGNLSAAGGPAGAYIAALIGAEIAGLYAGKTKLDILLVPLGTVAAGGAAAYFISPLFGWLMATIGQFINHATEMSPIFYGIIISVVVGMVLTAPISSAALCAMLGLTGLAGGAATVGCCVNMIGFAVASFKDNGFSGLVSQGVGTSMLQVPNIVKKPIIWLPVIIVSAILGPLSTTLFAMTNTGVAAGMGTSGLVGNIGTFTDMLSAGEAWWLILIKIAVLHFILPGVMVWAINKGFKAAGWIKDGDMKLEIDNK